MENLGSKRNRLDLRAVEQRLAAEMNRRWEALKLIQMDLHDSLGSTSPAQYPDSLALPKQLRRDWSEAQQAYQTACDRWFAFVRHGTIPEDLMDLLA